MVTDFTGAVLKIVRWVAYIAGWALALISGPFVGLLPGMLSKMPVLVLILIGIVMTVPAVILYLGIGVRVGRWAKAGRFFLPASFSGWRYGVTLAGVGTSLLAVGITMLLFWNTKGSGMSGVPAGMAIAAASAFAYLGILATEISDWRNSPGLISRAPFEAAPLMNRAERILHQRLVNSLPECLIFAKVRMPGLFTVPYGQDSTAWYDVVSQLSVDFVVCLRESAIVVAAVELQTDSELFGKGKRDFLRKEQALKVAGVPLLRWSALNLPEEPEIRAAFTR